MTKAKQSPSEYWMRAGKGKAQPQLVIVNESEASASVKECFEEITTSLGFAVVNVIFRAFAKYPGLLRLQWEVLKPNALTQDFFDKTEVIRRQAMASVREHFTVADSRAVLRMQGFSDDALKEIKATLDFFLYGDPFLLLMASCLQSALAGRPLRGKPWAHLLPHYTHPTRTFRVPLVEMEAAPPNIQTVYRDIQKVSDLLFVPSDYRALGRWPHFLEPAWEDWKKKIPTAAYRRELRRLNELAVALAEDLPFSVILNTQVLRESRFTPPQIADILATVDLFQGLLPPLITNVAAFKIGLEGGSRPPAG
jgi:hypothetical protein